MRHNSPLANDLNHLFQELVRISIRTRIEPIQNGDPKKIQYAQDDLNRFALGLKKNGLISQAIAPKISVSGSGALYANTVQWLDGLDFDAVTRLMTQAIAHNSDTAIRRVLTLGDRQPEFCLESWNRLLAKSEVLRAVLIRKGAHFLPDCSLIPFVLVFKDEAIAPSTVTWKGVIGEVGSAIAVDSCLATIVDQAFGAIDFYLATSRLLLPCQNCRFYSGSPLLMCAVRPSGPRDGECSDFEVNT